MPGRTLRFALALAALAPASPAAAETILFVGNSFTYGAGSAVWKYRAETVTDLNGDGVGGVPALFKQFADQAGLDFQVSLETSPGKDFAWHWNEKRAVLDRRWDHVVLQGYSTLDRDKPGDPTSTIEYAGRFGRLFAARNSAVRVGLTASWARPDIVYRGNSPWTERPLAEMARDLHRAYQQADAASAEVSLVHPVGAAFTCAIAMGVADADPYDGIAYGRVDLWTYDHYHASIAGYYLEALTIFAGVTGRDPRSLGPDERAAAELGLSKEQAIKLQEVAWATTRPGATCA